MTSVYLLHFNSAMPRDRGHVVAPVQHYLGFAVQLDRRLEHHLAGRGARLTRAAVARGIGWVVARTWRGDRDLERRLKNRHEHSVFCPSCRPTTVHRAAPKPCEGCTGRVCSSCLRHVTRVAAGRTREHWRHTKRTGCR